MTAQEFRDRFAEVLGADAAERSDKADALKRDVCEALDARNGSPPEVMEDNDE